MEQQTVLAIASSDHGYKLLRAAACRQQGSPFYPGGHDKTWVGEYFDAVACATEPFGKFGIQNFSTTRW
jgi:hypothetical protein